MQNTYLGQCMYCFNGVWHDGTGSYVYIRNYGPYHLKCYTKLIQDKLSKVMERAGR